MTYKKTINLVWTIVVASIALPFLFPLVWTFISSFKSQIDVIASPPKWIFAPTLDNYERVFGLSGCRRPFRFHVSGRRPWEFSSWWPVSCRASPS
jgi:ABC-type glycerol-3-phosphate transport system permease component